LEKILWFVSIEVADPTHSSAGCLAEKPTLSPNREAVALIFPVVNPKKSIKSIPFVGPILVMINRLVLQHTVDRNDPTQRISRIFRNRKNIYIVQIGSNDGVTNDPIHQLLLANHSWEALLVEPVPYIFERLQNNYPNDVRFHFENAAISEEMGVLPFYHLHKRAREENPELPHWFDQIGSFDPSHIRRHFGKDLEPFIVAVDVQAIPMLTLFGRHQVERIDLLHIDAEGLDWAILRQVDLERFRPEIILFEHSHLSVLTKSEALSVLEKKYNVDDIGDDYFCRRRRKFYR
jgi:FkbM family methyltransferase